MAKPATGKVQLNQPLWYAPGGRFDQPAYESSTSSTPAERRHELRLSPQLRGFDWGAATFQRSFGAARLVTGPRDGVKAIRAYTNSDVVRVNDTNGMIKFRGKTEQVN